MEKRELILAVQEKLGYEFNDPRLLELALTHRSIAREPRFNNERLEFLGDAVLQLTVSTHLYRRFPDMPEGELAKTRSLLVRESTLADIARELQLDAYLQVGEGEKRSGAQHRDSLLCDVLEAVYGAVYLDGGFAQAEQVILSHLPHWDAGELRAVGCQIHPAGVFSTDHQEAARLRSGGGNRAGSRQTLCGGSAF